jgi:hypothetical protein
MDCAGRCTGKGIGGVTSHQLFREVRARDVLAGIADRHNDPISRTVHSLASDAAAVAFAVETGAIRPLSMEDDI